MLMTICRVTHNFFDQKTRCELPCLKLILVRYNSVRAGFTPVNFKKKCIIKNNLKCNQLKNKHKKISHNDVPKVFIT